MRCWPLPEVLTVRAPAKVNLALDVLARRVDGYHDVDTVFQELELADQVSLEPAEAAEVRVTGPFAKGTPADSQNLALQALHLAAGAAGEAADFLIRLEKNIPPAGGLGGGSSDAAAVLSVLSRRWPALQAKLPRLALALGSDVPFFLLGGTARGLGRGEVLEALPPLPPHDVVLFPFDDEAAIPKNKTASVFAALEVLPPQAPCLPGVVELLTSGHCSSRDLWGTNALELAAVRVMPGLGEFRRRVEEAIGEPVILSGAGPTWFWIGPLGQGSAIAAAARQANLTCIETRTALRS
ncbi:MAG: 4-diphosphocytidyl-2-C-methyl-D-erythritol kinase [Tepidiforma sp.]|nr:MAG: 4-diphosphocytidyl-2-C-methyl-D-erythritol kinase [Tepidiforma sp.]